MSDLEMTSDKGVEQSETGIIFDIQSYAIHDGPGVRTLVFMKGCPLSCWWCHNPEGRSPDPELMYFDGLCMKSLNCVKVCPENALTFEGTLSIDRNLCTGCGLCTKSCPTSSLKLAGRRIGVNELMIEIDKYNQLYGSPDGGVTFSGGDPMFQPAFLKEILKECKRHYIHTAIETSGYTSREALVSVMPFVDLFLYDLKLVDQDESIRYTGVPNELIKDNLTFLTENEKEIILRFPVIPGVTDTEDNVKGWLDFLTDLKGVREINLLPYHDVGEKFYRLDREYRMNEHHAPPEEKLQWIKTEFEKIGLIVRIGG